MKYWLIFLLLCLLPLTAHASYGIDIGLQSPLEQEVEAGTIITATFLISNKTEKKENFFIKLDMPEGFLSIPFEEPFFSLDPGETTLKLVAIRIPTNTLAGTYPIRLVIQGQTNPSLLTEQSFLLHVLKKPGCQGILKKAPNYILAGDSYRVEVEVLNTGNVPNTISINVIEYLGLPFIIDKKDLTLAPGKSETITITVTTPSTLENASKHFLTISLLDNEGNLFCDNIITEVEIFSKTPPKIETYSYLPMQTTIGYGMKNSKKQFFVELKGGGPLDERKNIDLFIRAPLIQEANVDRDLGGPPENGYLHYFDSFTDFYVGDGVYSLTPLTMLNRFGRGSSLRVNPSKASLKGLYIQDSSSVPRSELGAQVSYLPLHFLSFSLSSMQTHFKEKAEKILHKQNTAWTNSFLGESRHTKIGDLVAEYATTNGFFFSKNNHQSYYVYSKASFSNNFWYALQKIYAGTQFIGYYQDTDQLYSSIGFPIIKRLQGTLSYNTIDYNLAKSHIQKTAPRNHSANAGLSYSFPSGLYTSCYYNYIHFTNALRGKGYQTQFLSFNGGKSFQKWTCQGIIETGHYKETKQSSSPHFWQNYQIYTYYQPTPRQQYAIYTRIGYSQISENISWARIYGISSSLTLQKASGQILYELTEGQRRRQYVSSKASYTFKNQTFLELQGYWNIMKSQNGVVEFLISYTIPWKLPIKKNRSVGHITGKALYQESQEIPASNLVINCNGKRTLTNSKGEFTFPSLAPGQYHLFAEEKEKITTGPLPLPVHILGGETTKVHITFEHPSSLEGKIPIFDIDQETLAITGYLKNAIIAVESSNLHQKWITTSDSLGYFSFNKLAPGRWLLTIQAAEAPPYHYLEVKELLVDLFPGENKSLEIKMLPIKRQIRMIDEGTIR